MQLKNLKNKLFLILASVFISAFIMNPSFADAVQKNAPQKAKPEATALLPSKKENKNILNKFLITMLWVFGSCGVIYGVLVLYKRIKNPSGKNGVKPVDISQNLDSPSNMEDAINLVIKKF